MVVTDGEKDLESLYKAVSGKYDIGTYDDFKAKMQTSEDRKNFYDVISSKGLDLGDYDQYESRLKKKDSSTLPSQDVVLESTGTEGKASSDMPGQNDSGSVLGNLLPEIFDGKNENSINPLSTDAGKKFDANTNNALAGIAGIPNYINKSILSLFADDKDLEELNNLDVEQREDFINNMLQNSPIPQVASMGFLSKLGSDKQDELLNLSETINNGATQFETSLTEDIKDGNFSQAGKRILDEGIGTIPSIVQAMIPYVGIASIVGGSASNKQEEVENEGFGLSKRTTANTAISGAAEGLLEVFTKKLGGKLLKSFGGKATKESAKKLSNSLVENLVKAPVGEGLSEASTSAIQNLSDALVQGKEVKVNDALNEIMDSFILGAAVGGGMGSVTQVGETLQNASNSRVLNRDISNSNYEGLADAFSQSNLQELDEGQFNILNNPISRNRLESDLKKKVSDGEMTPAQSESLLKEFDETKSALDKTNGVNLDSKSRSKAVNLIKEKEKIKKEIENSDESLVEPQRNRIKEINEELSNIGRGSSDENIKDAQITQETPEEIKEPKVAETTQETKEQPEEVEEDFDVFDEEEVGEVEQEVAKNNKNDNENSADSIKPTDEDTESSEVKVVTDNLNYQIGKNSAGQVEIQNRDGSPANVSDSTRRKYEQEYIEKTNFDFGERAIREGVPEGVDPVELVASDSSNPKELAETLAVTDFEKELDPVQESIARNVKNNVSKESFDAHEGPRGEDVSKSYFSKEGKGLDEIAMNVEYEVYGDYNANTPRVTEQDVVDFMMNHRGANEYLDQRSPIKADLESKFEELTGLKPTKNNIEGVSGIKKDNNVSNDNVKETSKNNDIDDEVPFQKNDNNLSKITRKKFDKLINKLKKAFPDTDVSLFKSSDLNKILGDNGNTAVAQAYWNSINDRFNNNLDRLIKGTLPRNHVFNLGNPSSILKASGIPDSPIELASSLLKRKSTQKGHPFNLNEVKNLAKAIHNPIAVFESATIPGRKVLFTELSHTDKNGKTNNFVVALELNSERGGKINVHSIRSVYPRENIKIVKSINNGESVYLDKKRASEWLGKQQSNSADVTKQFKRSAKIIKNFKNPISDNDIKNQISDLDTTSKDLDVDFMYDGRGKVYGFVKDGVVYINEESINANTPIHEFGHLWNKMLKSSNPKLYKKGLDLVRNSLYHKRVKKNEAYSGLSEEQQLEEALATAIGDKGEAFVSKLDKNRFQKFLQQLKDWLKTNLFVNKSSEIDSLSLDEFLDGAIGDILGGKEIKVKEKDILDNDTRFQILGGRGGKRLGIEKLNSLAVAKELEGKEKTPEEVYMATGWERGVDGKWRFELYDGGVTFKNKQNGQLDEVIDYPELFEAYPKAKKIKVIFNPNLDGMGMYLPNLDRIYLNSNYSDAEMLSTLIHEIQHFIQKEEGFSSGASPEYVKSQIESKIDSLYGDSPVKKSLNKLLNLLGSKKGNNKSVEKELDFLKDKIARSDYELYQSVAGEVEARNAELRRMLSPEERAKNTLSSTEDVNRADQIVLDSTLSKQMSAGQSSLNFDNEELLKKTQNALNQLRTKTARIDVIRKEFSDYIKQAVKSDLISEFRKSDLNTILNGIERAKTKETLDQEITKVENMVYDLKGRSTMAKINRILKRKFTKIESGRIKANLTDAETANTINDVKSILKDYASSRKGVDDKKNFDKDYVNKLQDEVNILIQNNDFGTELISKNIALNILSPKTTSDSKVRFDMLDKAHEELKDLYEEGRSKMKDWVESQKQQKEEWIKQALEETNPKNKELLKTEKELKEQNKSFVQNIGRLFFNLFNGQGMGDLDSMFRVLSKKGSSDSYGGYFLDELSPKLRASETQKMYNLRKHAENFQKNQKRIYGSETKMIKALAKENVFNIERNGESIDVPLTKGKMINIWMNNHNPDLRSGLESNGYTSDVINEIESKLTKEDKEYAQFLFNFYDQYWHSVNNVYEKMYNYPMGKPEFYAGRVYRDGYAGKEVELLNPNNIARTAAGASTKSRIKNSNPIDAVDVNQALSRHIKEMEHFINFAEVFKEYDTVVRDKNFRRSVLENDPGIGDVILNQLEYYRDNDMARGGMQSQRVKFLDKLMSNYVKATLALKPKIAVTQMLSFVNGASFMPSEIKYLMKGYNPSSFFKDASYLTKNSQYLSNRLDMKALNQALSGLDTVTMDTGDGISSNPTVKAYTKAAAKGYDKIQNLLMSNVKFGDYVGVMGTVPVFTAWKQKYVDQGMSEDKANEKAMRKFEIAVDRAQQSQSKFGKSWLQRSEVGRYFSMFATSPMQNYRNAQSSWIELLRWMKGQEYKGKPTRNMMSVLNYSFAQPMMYVYLSNLFAGSLKGFFDDEEEPTEEDKSLMSSLLVRNMNSIPILGNALLLMVDKMLLDKEHSFGSLLGTPIIESPSKVVTYWERSKEAKSKKTKDKWRDRAIEEAVQLGTGLPIKTGGHYKELIGDFKNIKDEYDMVELLGLIGGYSNYMVNMHKKNRELSKKKKSKSKALDRGEPVLPF
ncbi:MuF-C-terminal domain-containing protein [Galbibacter sp. BG1]